MREIEERGAEAVIDDAIAEALDGPDAVYISVDIDVIDPGIAPGTGTPEPGGHAAARGAARRPADRRRRSRSPAWTSSRSRRRTTTPRSRRWPRNRVALELISALAAKRQAGHPVRFEPGARPPVGRR